MLLEQFQPIQKNLAKLEPLKGLAFASQWRYGVPIRRNANQNVLPLAKLEPLKGLAFASQWRYNMGGFFYFAR